MSDDSGRDERISTAALWAAIILYVALNVVIFFVTRRLDASWKEIIWAVSWLPTGYVAYRVRVALENYLRHGHR